MFTLFLVVIISSWKIEAQYFKHPCPVRICAYDSESVDRTGPAKLLPENINATLCTHLVYRSAVLKGNLLLPASPRDVQNSTGLYSRFNSLKKRHTHLKTILNIDIIEEHITPLEDSFLTTRLKFLETNLVPFLIKHNFDGLCVFWLHNFKRAYLFYIFLRTIRLGFKNYARTTRKYLLLMAVLHPYIPMTSLLIEITRELDFAIVGAFALYGSWEKRAYHHSLLYDPFKEDRLNIDTIIQWFVDEGCPRDKLVLGLTTYGFAMKLKDQEYRYGAEIITNYAPPSYFYQNGQRPYYEICYIIKQRSTLLSRYIGVPFLNYDDVWIGFDDPRSFQTKMFFMAWKYQLVGYYVASLNSDDHSNYCKKGHYPLLSALYQACTNRYNANWTKTEQECWKGRDYPCNTSSCISQWYFCDTVEDCQPENDEKYCGGDWQIHRGNNFSPKAGLLKFENIPPI